MKSLKTAVVIGLFQLLSLIPLSLARKLGRQLGRFAWLLNGQSRRVTEENIAICFAQMSEQDRTELAKKSLQHLGMLAMESAYVWRRPLPQLFARMTKVDGLEHWEAARAAGRGVLVLGPHIGNWEILGFYLQSLGQITFMYQPPENPAFDLLIRQARCRNGAELAPTNTSGVKAQLRALKRNEMVGVLPDQVPPLESGDFAPFFGIPALTVTMAHKLIQRTGSRVVIVYAKRVIASNDFHIVFEPVAEELYSEDALVSLRGLNQSVENCVRKAPEQYQWEYKRFKKQPDGEKKYYL